MMINCLMRVPPVMELGANNETVSIANHTHTHTYIDIVHTADTHQNHKRPEWRTLVSSSILIDCTFGEETSSMVRAGFAQVDQSCFMHWLKH